LIESVLNQTWLKVPFGLVIGTVFATGLDLFMPAAAESVNNKIQMKNEAGKNPAPPHLDKPRCSTCPMLSPPVVTNNQTGKIAQEKGYKLTKYYVGF
jgi:hypothetical protein